MLIEALPYHSQSYLNRAKRHETYGSILDRAARRYNPPRRFRWATRPTALMATRSEMAALRDIAAPSRRRMRGY